MSSGAFGKAISNIHNSVSKSLDYITNPKKTEKQLLVTGVNCYQPEKSLNTAQEFKEIQSIFSKNKAKNRKPILAHHYLISFDPKDNIEPEKAHELSEEIVDRFLKKKHQAVLSTHVDKKDHIHTHFIFNTYSIDGKKYESSPAKLREFKQIIDEVCLEHNLNPINKKKYKEKVINLNYGEWLKQKNIIEDKKIERFKYIREAIKSILKDGRVKNLEQLAKELKEKYQLEAKYKNYKTNQLYKNISFKSAEWEQSIRGKYDISLENIMLRLEGREIENNKYQEFCIENNTDSYKAYIKNAIDTELNNNNTITDVDDLAAVLKSKYNIEMKYQASNGTYLNRFKFKALDSKQKNFIGSASLDKENRNNYELEGIKNKISSQSIQFGIDLRENLKILNRNLLVSGKEDRWGINVGLDYMTKKNLRTRNDIDIRRTEIRSLKGKNELEIEKINKFISDMDITYERLKKKMMEVKSIEKEIQELGIFKLKQKKELSQKLESLKSDIERLKESEHYQKEMKYSEKLKELNESKQELTEKLKECEHESDLIYKIEKIDNDKDSLMKKLQLDYQREQEEQQQQEKNFNKTMGFDL